MTEFLTKVQYDHFFSRLGTDSDAANLEFVMLRKRLIQFFRMHGLQQDAEEWADRALDRAIYKIFDLEKNRGEEVLSLSGYIFTIAKFVAREARKEWAKKREREISINAITTLYRDHQEFGDINNELTEKFHKILESLPKKDLELLISYYSESSLRRKQRQQLANALQITPLNLRVKVLRLRQKIMNEMMKS